MRKTLKMAFVLYKTDGSPPARAAMMVVDLLGLKVKTSEVFPPTGDHLKPEFVQKNPIHTIPFIEDGNFRLADSHAIITYLMSKYGDDKKLEWYPNDLEVRATVDQRMYMDATIVFPKIRAMLATSLIDRKSVPTNEQLAEVKEVYGILEKYLEQTRFFAADHLTLADISLVASVSTLDGVIPVNEFPKLSQWFETMQQYDWYQSANKPGLEKITKMFHKNNKLAITERKLQNN
ncbi:unnamed protein product [Diatraea saccharalis]|uniref:Uncharacterized protein n=1 Tax=Diatraea saccharalis TaxID=40085 RepID=A0A9N9WLA7_9NEOP|nr:unnamed protein product [Diatraea saccharalis]